MPAVIVRQIGVFGEIHPLFGQERFLRSVQQVQTETPMNHTGLLRSEILLPS